MRAEGSGGWCAPAELIYGYRELLPMAYAEFTMQVGRACLPCEVGSGEHPLNEWCADTLAREWVEYVERAGR